MNISCGTDIIEVERIKENIDTDNNKFINRVFTQAEIEYCESKNVQKYQSYAGKFAAKEAIFKALSNKLEDKFSIGWKDIEILNNKEGRPIVNLSTKNTETHADADFNINNIKNKIENIDVSISHIKEYAVANAVILFKE